MTSRGVGVFAALTAVTALLLGAPGCGDGTSAGTDGASVATATPKTAAQFGLTPEPEENPARRQPFGLTPEPGDAATPIQQFGLTPEPQETPRPSSSPTP